MSSNAGGVGNGRIPQPDVSQTGQTPQSVPPEATTGLQQTDGAEAIEAEIRAQLRRDAYVAREQRGLVGPGDSEAGLSSADSELIEHVFATSPFNAATTPKLHSAIHGDPKLREGFDQAVDATNAYLTNPTEDNQRGATQKLTHFQQLLEHGNAMEVLFLVFRESIKEVAADSKYWIERMQEANKLSDSIADYMDELVDDSSRLSEKMKDYDGEYPQKVTVDTQVKSFEISAAAARSPSGQLQQPEATSVETKSLNQNSLNHEIQRAQMMAEQAKNLSDRFETQFQGTDQKKNQLYQLLSSVMRSMNEMREVGAASRSGL